MPICARWHLCDRAAHTGRRSLVVLGLARRPLSDCRLATASAPKFVRAMADEVGDAAVRAMLPSKQPARGQPNGLPTDTPRRRGDGPKELNRLISRSVDATPLSWLERLYLALCSDEFSSAERMLILNGSTPTSTCLATTASPPRQGLAEQRAPAASSGARDTSGRSFSV